MTAQAVNNQIKDVVMPSANAASLGKYGDIPVGYYTGIPSIGIPIHTVQEGAVSLPIALSYHAGGVKAGEHNSWVGLGWSLSAGGIISRTVQGKADESAFGYFTIGKEIGTNADTCITRNGSSGTTLPDAQFGTEIANGQKDGEPDMFNFSIGGYSGKFYIDVDNSNNNIVDGKVILVPKQDLKVEYVVASNSTNVTKLYKFTITTPDGTKYEFGNNNESLTDIANDAIEITKPFNTLCDRYASSWYLKRIISYDGLDIISLFYKKENYRYGYRASAGAPSQNTLGSALGGYRAGIMDIIGCRLETITTSSAKESVTFVANVNRTDLDVTPGTADAEKAKRLSSISIQTGAFCKQFILSHTYFEDNSAAKSGQYTDFRLKLNSVQEANCTGADSIKPYIFTYNQQPTNPKYLPNRLTGAVDHWGYFNGAVGNTRRGYNMPYTRLIYTVQYTNNTTRTFDVKEGSSNRETNPDSMKLGTISQIQYPTGGTTAFDYEANTYWDSAGIKKIQEDGDFSLYWANGGQCSMNNTSTPFFKTFSAVDNMFFAWATKKATNYCNPCSCTDIVNNPSKVILKVFQGSGTTELDTKEISCGGNDTLINILSDKLSNLFPFLVAGVNYRFELSGSNSASKFLFQKEVLADPALNNRKVGGLRIKTMTISDGVNTANNIVKTYDYSSSIPSISSGVLYNRPAYGHVFRNTVGYCNQLNTAYFVNHIFIDNSIVPLSSFEGYHIGYRKVKEYINNGLGNCK